MAVRVEVPTLSMLRSVALLAVDVLGREDFDRIIEQSTRVREIDGVVKSKNESGVICATDIGACFVPCNADTGPSLHASLMLKLLPCHSGPYIAWAFEYSINDEGWKVKNQRQYGPIGKGQGGKGQGGKGQGKKKADDVVVKK